MLQLYLSPQQSQGRPALPRVSTHEHVGAHQNGLTCSWHLYCTFVCPSLYSVSFNVKMPWASNMEDFTVFADILGFLPQSSPTAEYECYVLLVHLFPPLTVSDWIQERIVLATRCNQFHSDTLWVVFLKCEPFYQMGKLNSIALAWVQTDTEKYKQD